MWFAESKEQVLRTLAVKPADGLTYAEAKERLEKYGENKLRGKPKKSPVGLFIKHLQDTLIYVLLAAAAITVFIGEYMDAIIILGVIIINAAIGVFQEYKAGKEIEALMKLSSPLAVVRRGGSIYEIRSEEVVPGDIVILEAGGQVPADLRIIKSANLHIEESALTGESVPAEKDSDASFRDTKIMLSDLSNMAFMSTFVTSGRGEGVVVGTGMATEIGRIATIIDAAVDKTTPLQKRLNDFGRRLGILTVCVCLIMFAISFLQGRDFFDMFLTAISLTVSAIPESLPAIVAIVMAMGAIRMSKINAIVKQLSAVETLGAVNIICADKTGTLTQNKMTVVKSYTINHLKDVPVIGQYMSSDSDEAKLINSLVLCSDATIGDDKRSGDPTEIALIVLGNKFNL